MACTDKKILDWFDIVYPDFILAGVRYDPYKKVYVMDLVCKHFETDKCRYCKHACNAKPRE